MQEHFHKLHQRGDDQDKGHGLHKAQTLAVQKLVDGPVHSGGHTHYEDNCHAHAQSGFNLLGHAHKGADDQELGQDEVVNQNRAQGD